MHMYMQCTFGDAFGEMPVGGMLALTPVRSNGLSEATGGALVGGSEVVAAGVEKTDHGLETERFNIQSRVHNKIYRV